MTQTGSSGAPGREPESPRAYRDKNPYTPPPREYKPPSMLAEHKGLAILFTVMLIAFAAYCWKAPRRPSLPVRPVAGQAAAVDAGAVQAGAVQAGAVQAGAAEAAHPLGNRPVSALPEPPAGAARNDAQPIYVEPLPEKDNP